APPRKRLGRLGPLRALAGVDAAPAGGGLRKDRAVVVVAQRTELAHHVEGKSLAATAGVDQHGIQGGTEAARVAPLAEESFHHDRKAGAASREVHGGGKAGEHPLGLRTQLARGSREASECGGIRRRQRYRRRRRGK